MTTTTTETLTGWFGPSLRVSDWPDFPNGALAVECSFGGPYGGWVGSPLLSGTPGARRLAAVVVSASRDQDVALSFAGYRDGNYVCRSTHAFVSVNADTPESVWLDQVLPSGDYDTVSVVLDGPAAQFGDVLALAVVGTT